MIKELIKIANELDKKGLRKESDCSDSLIKTALAEPASPAEAMTKIKEIAEEALMNKSFGLPMSGVADRYWVDIIRVLESVTGGSTLPGGLERYETIRTEDV